MAADPSKKNGIYDEIVEILQKAGKRVFEFSGILANPTYSNVALS